MQAEAVIITVVTSKMKMYQPAEKKLKNVTNIGLCLLVIEAVDSVTCDVSLPA